MGKIHHICSLISLFGLVSVVYSSTRTLDPGNNDAAIPLIDIEIPVEKQNKSLNANQISKLHLFGNEAIAKKISKKDEKKIKVVQDLANLPKSKVNLEVSGVLSQKNTLGGYAIIVGSNGKAKSYKVGDEIQKNIFLHSIHSGHVVLDNNKRLEKLILPKTKTKNGKKSPRSSRFIKRASLRSFGAKNFQNKES